MKKLMILILSIFAMHNVQMLGDWNPLNEVKKAGGNVEGGLNSVYNFITGGGQTARLLAPDECSFINNSNKTLWVNQNGQFIKVDPGAESGYIKGPFVVQKKDPSKNYAAEYKPNDSITVKSCTRHHITYTEAVAQFGKLENLP